MTVQEFITKWRKVALKERSAAQEHFLDLCAVFDHPTPGTVGGPRDRYIDPATMQDRRTPDRTPMGSCV